MVADDIDTLYQNCWQQYFLSFSFLLLHDHKVPTYLRGRRGGVAIKHWAA
jgi:hypothetical protein